MVRNMTVTVPRRLYKQLTQTYTKGQGGFQSLSQKLKQHSREKGQIELDVKLLHTVAKYAVIYGDGGYQQALAKLLALYVYEAVEEQRRGLV